MGPSNVEVLVLWMERINQTQEEQCKILAEHSLQLDRIWTAARILKFAVPVVLTLMGTTIAALKLI